METLQRHIPAFTTHIRLGRLCSLQRLHTTSFADHTNVNEIGTKQLVHTQEVSMRLKTLYILQSVTPTDIIYLPMKIDTCFCNKQKYNSINTTSGFSVYVFVCFFVVEGKINVED